MEERRRLAYLEAMGFQPLVPRWRLPGARPSPRCEISPLPSETVAHAAAEPATVPPAPRMPELEPAPPRRAARPRAAPLQRAARPAAERFALTVGLVPGRVLLLDDGGSGGDYQQLLANLTRALLGGAECALQREMFRWPLVDNPALDHSRGAARQALQALVAAQAEKLQLRAVLLMGDIAASLLFPESERGSGLLRDGSLPVPALITDSARNMLSEPARKRQVWQDVQPLVELLAD